MDEPFIVFHQLYPDAPAPRAADQTLAGSIPLRAYRYCEPFTAASGFGWYLYPPIDFSLKSDGDIIYWKVGADEPWMVLDHAVALPGFLDHCREHGAKDLATRGVPPFIGRGRESNLVQLWLGVIARTRPGWSLLVRPLANHPRDSRYEMLDGMVQTDWWFGPLVTPLRIRKTDEPIRFLRANPVCQLQPILTDSYTRRDHATFDVRTGVAVLSDDDWNMYRHSLDLPEDLVGPRHSAYKRRARASGRTDMDR